MALGLLTGALVNAMIQMVVDVASKHMEDYFKERKGMGKELRRLNMLLPKIQSVVDTAERGEQQISDPLKKWLWQLKDAVYEAVDVLDELDYHQLKQRVEADHVRLAKRIKIFRPDPTLDKLRRVVKKLEEVAAGAEIFVKLLSKAQQKFQQQENQAILKRRTGPLLTENKVFGREKERDELLRWLTMMPADQKDEINMDVSLFSVVGHGGMGKTTLAQLVYKDNTVQQSFDLKIWVCVFTPFDVEGLTRSILEQATKQRPNVDGFSALQVALKEKLETSGKFLLVLDDVWNYNNQSNWEKLLAPLKYGRNGSKILLTTRMDGVADMAAQAMGASKKKSLKLDGLYGEDFSSLFNRYAFAGVDPGNYQNLQHIGMQITKRLGSSPLTAKIVGGLLNSKLNERYWITILRSKNISNQVQPGEDNIQPGEDNIMSILKLSYYHLPLHLRPCFAYCGMYPKDHEFDKKDLVLMWMAVGFILHAHQNQGETLEDVGGYYFDELLNRSLFNHKYGDYYVMHDLLHDLAQSISQDECFSFVDDDKNVEGTVRHLYIESDNLDILTKVDNLHNLRSLVLKIKDAGSEHSSGLEKLFTSLKSIRMLNIDLGKREVTMPDAFSHLIHLRTLKIVNTLQNLPISLCKLYHLQVFKFGYKEGTIKLPESINKLVNLRHMSANHRVAGVGKLKFLQDLSFSVKKERGYKIGELGDLIWLHSLRIKGLENVENQEEASAAKLCNKEYLQTLHLGWSVSSDPGLDMDELVLDRLRPYSNLKGLTIEGYRGIRYANWMGFEQINNLQRISLSDFSRLEHFPPLGRLPSLEHLELTNLPSIKKLDYQYQHLKELHIRDMEGLEELSRSGGDASRWHPHLHTLRIKNCPKLEVLPSLSLSIREIRLYKLGLVSLPTLWLDRSSTCSTSESLSSSSSLEILEIDNCGKITSLCNGLLMQQHYLTALTELTIRYCPELVDFPSGGLQHLRALKRMEIVKCPKLQVAPEPITPDGNDEMFLPMSLQSLWIEGCDELERSMPALLKGLVSLDELYIKDCEELMSLEGLMGLQGVWHLVIWNCPELVDFPSGGLQHLRALKTVEIWKCPKLQMAPDPITPDWNDEMFLPMSLRSLQIKGCVELVRSMPALLKGLVSLDYLYLEDCEELMSLEGLMGLQSIGFLEICGCPKLVNAVGTSTVWPDLTLVVDRLVIYDPLLLVSGALRSLTSVRELSINNLGDMEDLSILEQWLLQNHTTLEKIQMWWARSLKSLPHSLKNLSSLKSLQIYRASEGLMERCREDEGADWPNISHIRDIRIRDE